MKETLRKFGLSQSEIKVYLALLELGSTLAGRITKQANINRTNCYDSLERLTEKGLVSYVIKSNRKYFKAETPEELQLKEKEKEINKIIPELIRKSEENREKPEATIYQGKKGIKSIFEDILKHKEYLVFGSSGKFKEVLEDFFYQFQKRVNENHIKSQLIVSEKARNTDITSHAETRYIPQGYITLSSTLIYGNKVAIISWTSNPTGFLLEDKQIADSYRTYFKFMWQIAKK